MSTTTLNTDVSREIIASFFPEQGERTEVFGFLKNVVENYVADISTIKVNPSMSKADIAGVIARYDFDGSLPAASVLGDVINLMEQGMVHVTSPNYFGLFNPTSSFWGGIADFITALYNPQLAVWSHAPACVDIEEKLIRYLGQLAGFTPAHVGGAFTTGGAEANCTALICALTRKIPGFAKQGLQSQPSQPVFYISADSHLAWLKIALQSGLGHDAVRLVGVDVNGKMDVAQLSATLADDRQRGFTPFMLVGTAGTTNAGVIDPLAEMAVVAREQGLYFHVDAAWAGAILLSDHHSPLLRGIELADSITLDAHKWLTAPMGTGMFICADKTLLNEPFAVSTNYMPAGDDVNIDPYVNSMQWSRRFNGLKLFIPLAILGRAGFSKMIDYQVELGAYLKSSLELHGWVVVNATPLPVICFKDAGGVNIDQLLVQVLAANQVWLSSTTFNKEKALRTCITSYRSTRADVDNLLVQLNQARDAVRKSG
ncbi:MULTISPECIES: aminotransferase class V-fold PLP-dependent enzyme [Pseudomonas]|uniref:Aspartate aminotransferase family protein n=1 Tax=Pseudomonas sp. Hg7Tf TaxID=3236988 RepID=A0AB39HR86_9PSED|nr:MULTISPECIES: aminotransferase class V-fold PLP-dependent enzyme [Pseudomonas]MDD1975039.1 aminotransferase class V-fold PLP-dependent enzyme [Pseudomonas putida]MDH2559253.1 aminotransferase class V-fold PLP-dependent enzyme [Pseudomonas sp. Hg5Tf]